MKPYLWLRLDAPMMSFGGVQVDNRGVTDDHPGLSLLTGLLGNALGWRHAQMRQLEELQERIEFGVRRDVAGQVLTDYQTVDLGQSYLGMRAWTTRGSLEERAGASSDKTHIRYRSFVVDAIYTLALTLRESATGPTLEEVAQALESPARPLFIGRKCCPPAAPLLLGKTQASDVADALKRAPLHTRVPPKVLMTVWLPSDAPLADDGAAVLSDLKRQYSHDRRDWFNQVHTGGHYIERHEWPVEVSLGG